MLRKRQLILGEFPKWGYDVRGWSERTRTLYVQNVLRADGWLAHHRNTSILFCTVRDIQAYVFSTKPAPRTRNLVRHALCGFYSFLLDRGYREDNPASALPNLKVPPAIPKALTHQQARLIMRVAKALGPDIHVFVGLLLANGLRHTEARTLQWHEIEDGGEYLRFRAKGGQERRLYIHKEVQRALRVWRRVSNNPQWVFPSPVDPTRPVSISSTANIVREVGELADIPGLHAHQLRHTFATGLLETGTDLRTLQEALGHAHLASSEIYLKVRNVKVKDAINRWDFDADTG